MRHRVIVKETTRDTFFNGAISVMQSAKGYRFSVDAVILAFYARPRPGSSIIDLGTGCGIIPLIIAHRNPETHIYGVEIQESLAALAMKNVSDNNMETKVKIISLDMKALTCKMTKGPVNLVVANPPYRKAMSGRINPREERAVARHEIKARIGDVVKTASRMLMTKGKFLCIYPAQRLGEMIHEMKLAGIEPKFLRMIHSKAGAGAKLFVVEGTRGGRSGLTVAPPLYIYTKDGADYTDEMESMFTE